MFRFVLFFISFPLVILSMTLSAFSDNPGVKEANKPTTAMVSWMST